MLKKNLWVLSILFLVKISVALSNPTSCSSSLSLSISPIPINGNKLSSYFSTSNNQITINNYTENISNTYIPEAVNPNVTAVGSIYKGESIVKTFTLSHNPIQESDVNITYRPLVDPLYFRLQLDYDFINENGQSVVLADDAKPILYNSSNQLVPWMATISGQSDYRIHFPYLGPNVRIIFIEKITLVGCIQSEGASGGVELKQCGDFIPLTRAVDDNGQEKNKLLYKFQKNIPNKIFFEPPIPYQDPCLSPENFRKTFRVKAKFRNNTVPSDISTLTLSFWNSSINFNIDNKLIHVDLNSIRFILKRKKADGTIEESSIRLSDNFNGIRFQYEKIDSTIGCTNLSDINFLKKLTVIIDNPYTTDEYIFQYDEVACCPTEFLSIMESNILFSSNSIDACNINVGDWSNNRHTLPENHIDRIEALMDGSISPIRTPNVLNAGRLTYTNLPSQPVKIVGMDDYEVDLKLAPVSSNYFIYHFDELNPDNFYAIIALRYQQGLHLAEYNDSGQPINGTLFDYTIWNQSPAGIVNPKFPYKSMTFLSNGVPIQLPRLETTDPIYNTIKNKFSTYPSNNVVLFKIPRSMLPIQSPNQSVEAFNRSLVDYFNLSKLSWTFEPRCELLLPSDNQPEYSLEWYIVPDLNECLKCALPMARYKNEVQVNCPGCRFTGGDVFVSSSKRVTVGYLDTDNDSKPNVDASGMPIPASINVNLDNNLSNDLNLNFTIRNDIIQLRNHYYLTNGQVFPYGPNNQMITMDDNIFGVNALIHSYLKVNLHKGFKLTESDQQRMKITLYNGSTILAQAENISIFNSNGSLNQWIIEEQVIGDTRSIVFDFSIQNLRSIGLSSSIVSFKSDYSIAVEFYVQVVENIKGDEIGRKDHKIVFAPYFSKVNYLLRDTRYNNGILPQINGFEEDGDPYFIENEQVLFTWENFNSPNRFVNEMNNIYYNSNKLLNCGNGETTITTWEIIYRDGDWTNTNINYNAYNAGCGIQIIYSTTVDFGIGENIFKNEYRPSNVIDKLYFNIPKNAKLKNIIYSTLNSNRSAIRHQKVSLVNQLFLSLSSPAIHFVKENNEYSFYYLEIDKLSFEIGSPIVREDERVYIQVIVDLIPLCNVNGVITNNTVINPINKEYSPYFTTRENTVDISQLIKNANEREILPALPNKPVLIKANNSIQVQEDNLIETTFDYYYPKYNESDYVINNNYFVVIEYNPNILVPPILVNRIQPNTPLPFFDRVINSNKVWRYFYKMENHHSLEGFIPLKLSTAFSSCPDNNFKLYIGYGYNCSEDVYPTMDFNTICEFIPPSDLNYVTVFVKEAFVNVSNVRYPNESCGQVELQYNLISNQGIAKDVSSTIQLPVGFNYNQQPITVRYGNNVLPSDQYSLSFISPSTLQLSILDQNIPFAKQLEIGTTAVDIIEVSIPLLYEEGCVLYSNVSIPISVRYTSICPEYKTETTTSLIPSLLNCPRTGSVMGRLSQPNGSGTILCKDSDNQFTPIQITFTQDPSMTSAYTYEWYQGNGSAFTTIVGQSSPTITVNNPSTIKVKVTDINTGCYGEFTTTVSDQIVFLPIDPVCKGQSPRLQLNGLNNVQGSITTSWFRETNPNELLFSLSEEGMYKAMAIVPGCTLTTATAYDIRFKEAPIPYIFERDLIYHGQNDVTISILNPTANPLGSVSIRWSHDAQKINLESFNTNKDGVYSVTATLLSTGCSVISSTKIVSPQIRILPLGADACALNSSIVLMAESNIVAGNYIWQKINPLTRVGTTISTSATVNISETGLYAVSNDLTVQTCDASYFYINLDKGSIRPIDLISNNSSDGNFENISSCSPVGFLTDYACLSTVPDFSNPNYAQDLLGRFILTPNAALWNRPNLWTGQALNNPNYNIPAAQQQMMVVDGSTSSRVWSKEISIEDYPYFLQEFMFTAHVRNIESNAVAVRREIPKMNYSISFKTSGPNPIQRLVSKGVLNEITFNTNQRNWIQMTAFVNRFQEFIGCADDDVESDFTHAIIELSLQNGGDIGRDFAIDEISFIPLDVYHCVENTTATTTSFAYRMVPRPCEASLFKVMTTEFHTCPGIGATLTAQKYTDAASLSYSWSKDNTTLSNNLTLSVNPSVTTTYTFRVVDTENQCSFEKAVTVYVTQPEISIQSNAINACIQPEISFEVDRFTIIGNISYEWSVNNNIIPNEKDRKFVHRSVTNGDEVSCRLIHHCTNPDGSSLLVQSNSITLKGQLEQANAGQDTSICATDRVTIGTPVNSVNTYNWSTPTEILAATSATVQVQPATTTTYTLQLIDANTCITEDDVVIHVKGPKPQVQAGPDLQVCSGSSVTATQASTNAASVLWSPTLGLSSPTDINPIFSPSSDTEFTLTATHSSTGCSASDNVLVAVHPLPSGELEYSNQRLQVQIQQPELYTYQWSGFNIPNTWSESYLNVSESGRFSVMVQNKQTGCSTTLFKDVQVTNIVAPDGSPLISLYPNPMQHRLQVHTHSSTSIKTMEWITVTGTVVQLNEINQPQAEISSYLASGMYILKITLIDGKILYHQMVIE